MGLSCATLLGPYQIVPPLGVGGMDEVCRARDTRLGRDIVVKVPPEAPGKIIHALGCFGS